MKKTMRRKRSASEAGSGCRRRCGERGEQVREDQDEEENEEKEESE